MGGALFEDFELLHGSAEYIADFLGCSVRNARRYKAGTLSLPEPCRRLLVLRRNGELSALLGSAWNGFVAGRDGLLYVPGWRNGMAPDRISAMFFTQQENAALRVEVKRLREELWALQQVRRCYSLPQPAPTTGARQTPPARRST